MQLTVAGRVSCCLWALTLSITNLSASPLGTAFTYQGRLVQGGSPANGWYDFRLGLWDSTTGGNQYGATQTISTVGVTNGLFTVAVDFGSVFNGNALWLEIATRTNGAASFTTLAPRLALTAAPYANYSPLAGGAGVASLANAVAPGSVTSASLAPGAVTSLGAPGLAVTNAVVVNTNGWVGVGTNSPNGALEVTGGSSLLGLTVYATVADGTGNVTNLLGGGMLAVSGNLLAMPGGADNGVTLFDSSANSLSWQANLVNGQGNYTNLNGPLGVAISPNNLLAVASTRSSAVTLVDVSNPNNPVWKAALVNNVGGWNDLAGAYAVAFQTNLLAIASSNANAVTLADVSNPAAPVQKVVLRNLTFGFNYLGMPNGVAFSGTLLAISSWSSNAVTLVDVSTPASPILKSVLNSANGCPALKAPWSVAVDNGLLAVGSYALDAVSLIDISNPVAPVQRSVLQNNGPGINNFVSPLGLAFLHRNGRVLLAIGARDSDRLLVFDVTDPVHPIVRANFQANLMGLHYVRSPRGLAFNANGQLAYVSAGIPAALSLVGLPEAQAGFVSDTWVGIGTASPKASLDVVGDVLIENANRFEVHAGRIEMGTGASATGSYATAIGDGVSAGGAYATALGYQNTASGDLSTVLGYANTASGKYSTAVGFNTTASGAGSMAAGSYAQAVHTGSFVWCDYDFTGYFSSTAPDQFLIHAANGVGINKNNPAAALDVNGTIAATALGIGTTSPQGGILDIQGNTHINNYDLYLRTGIDLNHGLGWYGVGKLFAGQNVDGPVLYGWSGGGLGTTGGSGARLTAAWNTAGEFNVDPGNMNTGSVSSASLVFGSGSGEGIASRRTSTPTQFTLDFYTGFQPRMSIFNNGSITIGGTNAEHTLDVTGDVGIRGGLGINTKDQQDPNWSFLPAIIFGDFATSGEMITSQRGTNGPNQWGLDLYTRSTSRIAIANNGNVGIGRQPTANRLEVAGNASKDTAGSWLANSDARIKQEIQPVTGALDTLDRVRLVSFRYTDDYRHAHPGVEDRPYLNVVAQEFREVFPHEVKSSGEKLPDGNEILQVDTYPLTIYSAAAVQELNRKLEKEIQTKEAELQELKQRLERLERAFEQKR